MSRDRLLMRHQFALRPTKMQFLQPGDAAPHILLQVAPKRISTHPREPCDLLMRKLLAFQPERFHLASHAWMLMVKAFVCQGPCLGLVNVSLNMAARPKNKQCFNSTCA